MYFLSQTIENSIKHVRKYRYSENKNQCNFIIDDKLIIESITNKLEQLHQPFEFRNNYIVYNFENLSVVYYYIFEHIHIVSNIIFLGDLSLLNQSIEKYFNIEHQITNNIEHQITTNNITFNLCDINYFIGFFSWLFSIEKNDQTIIDFYNPNKINKPVLNRIFSIKNKLFVLKNNFIAFYFCDRSNCTYYNEIFLIYLSFASATKRFNNNWKSIEKLFELNIQDLFEYNKFETIKQIRKFISIENDIYNSFHKYVDKIIYEMNNKIGNEYEDCLRHFDCNIDILNNPNCDCINNSSCDCFDIFFENENNSIKELNKQIKYCLPLKFKIFLEDNIQNHFKNLKYFLLLIIINSIDDFKTISYYCTLFKIIKLNICLSKSMKEIWAKEYFDYDYLHEVDNEILIIDDICSKIINLLKTNKCDLNDIYEKLNMDNCNELCELFLSDSDNEFS